MGERMKRFHLQWQLLAHRPHSRGWRSTWGRIVPKEPTGPADDWTWWTPFSYPFDLTQQPALSVPCGCTKEGLPVGLQLVAPSYREDLALRAAHAFQGARIICGGRRSRGGAAGCAGGGSYQTTMNTALREFMARRDGALAETLRHVLREELAPYLVAGRVGTNKRGARRRPA